MHGDFSQELSQPSTQDIPTPAASRRVSTTTTSSDPGQNLEQELGIDAQKGAIDKRLPHFHRPYYDY